MAVLDVRLFALGDQLLDLGNVAVGGCGVQSGIDAQLPFARRRLRGCELRRDDGQKTERESRKGPVTGADEIVRHVRVAYGCRCRDSQARTHLRQFQALTIARKAGEVTRPTGCRPARKVDEFIESIESAI